MGSRSLSLAVCKRAMNKIGYAEALLGQNRGADYISLGGSGCLTLKKPAQSFKEANLCTKIGQSADGARKRLEVLSTCPLHSNSWCGKEAYINGSMVTCQDSTRLELP